MLKDLRSYIVIWRSGLFDKKYYLQNYPDVRKADVDPLMHFVKHGWKEGRNQSSNFGPKLFFITYSDEKETINNGFMHYIRNGKKKARSLKPSLMKILHLLLRRFIFLWKLKGIVFFGGYPYPEVARDGYYQRIRSVDILFNDRWRIYVDRADLPGRETWYDIPAPNTLVLRISCNQKRKWLARLCLGLCVLRTGVIYLHSILTMSGIELFLRLPGITKIIDLHGVVPEEFRYQGDFINAQHYGHIERFIVTKFKYIIVVSEAMRHHIEEKYHGIIGGQFITLPIFQRISVYRSEKPYVNGKPVIIYTGGLQKWQQVPKMVNAITSTAAFYIYKFYCPEPKKVLAMLPENLRGCSSLEIDSKPLGEILQVYRECHYGFILREDIIVNHVACPTKLVEYLAMGIVPIVDCEDIGDFKFMGMGFVHLDDLLNNRLPDESTRKDIAKINFGVYEKLLDKYNVGGSTLQRSISFRKLIK